MCIHIKIRNINLIIFFIIYALTMICIYTVDSEIILNFIFKNFRFFFEKASDANNNFELLKFLFLFLKSVYYNFFISLKIRSFIYYFPIIFYILPYFAFLFFFFLVFDFFKNNNIFFKFQKNIKFLKENKINIYIY